MGKVSKKDNKVISSESGITELTEAENELYDRQIRLWGLESQKRIRSAKILISGLNGLGAEVTKNLILSGVNSVKLHDDRIVTEEDFCSQFLVPRSALGKNRAEASIARSKALNPMVDISYADGSLSTKNEDFFTAFDVVIIIAASNLDIVRIDEICRENSIKFFAGNVWGTFGYTFADLQKHQFIEDIVKHKVISKPGEKIKTELITTTAHRELDFKPFSTVLNFDINSEVFQKKLKRTGPALILLRILMKFHDDFQRHPFYKTRNEDIEKLIAIRNEISNEQVVPDNYFELIFAQISPAAAVVGGVLAQEIIKVVSKKEAPHNNVFLFDPETCCGFVETIVN